MEQQDQDQVAALATDQFVWPHIVLERVSDHMKREEWEKAFQLLSDYVHKNPYHGDLWHDLGEYHERAQQYDLAGTAYRKAIEYGNCKSGETEYKLARTLMRQGKSDEAVGWLERSLRSSLSSLEELDSDGIWETMRTDPRFVHLFSPRVADDIGRDAGWRTDLQYLKSRMEQAHYELFGRETPLTRDVWEAAIEQLDQRIPTLEDHEIAVGLMKIVALAGDGHTRAFPFDIEKGYLARQSELFAVVPVLFYFFEDGLFIRAARKDYAEAVGARVLRIGNTPAEQVLERISPVVFQDNIMQVKRHGPSLLACPAILHALGMTESPHYLDVLLQQEQNEPFTMRFQKDASAPHQARSFPVDPEQWATMRDTTQPQPLWLKDRSNLYWFEYLEERKIVYCQYNGVNNKEEETLADFSERLFTFIEAHEVQALILDLRANGGGNLTTYRPLLHGLIRCQKINQKGRFFALIGRQTFSAAQHFTGQLDLHTQVIFVGEPSGSRPQFVGEGNNFTLPFSGLNVNASNLFWQTTFAIDRRMWMPPDICAEFTSQHYKTNRDPALEAIFAVL